MGIEWQGVTWRASHLQEYVKSGQCDPEMVPAVTAMAQQRYIAGQAKSKKEAALNAAIQVYPIPSGRALLCSILLTK